MKYLPQCKTYGDGTVAKFHPANTDVIKGIIEKICESVLGKDTKVDVTVNCRILEHHGFGGKPQGNEKFYAGYLCHNIQLYVKTQVGLGYNSLATVSGNIYSDYGCCGSAEIYGLNTSGTNKELLKELEFLMLEIALMDHGSLVMVDTEKRAMYTNLKEFAKNYGAAVTTPNPKRNDGNNITTFVMPITGLRKFYKETKQKLQYAR